MMKTFYEWRCLRCGKVYLSSTKPQPTAMIKRVPSCTCGAPTRETGRTELHPVLGRARY
jgi:hypothetical protein